jgi:hypothetical protein
MQNVVEVATNRVSNSAQRHYANGFVGSIVDFFGLNGKAPSLEEFLSVPHTFSSSEGLAPSDPQWLARQLPDVATAIASQYMPLYFAQTATGVVEAVYKHATQEGKLAFYRMMGLSEKDADVLDNLFDDRQEQKIFSRLLEMAKLESALVEDQACFIRRNSVRILANAAIRAAKRVRKMKVVVPHKNCYANPQKVPSGH